MSVKEYAALKGVRRETVERWIKHGYVRAERVGPRGYYRIITEPRAASLNNADALGESRVIH